MNITFYSNVTTKDSVLSYIPRLKEHNVRIYNLNETEEMLKEVSDTEIMIWQQSAKKLLTLCRSLN